MYRRPCIWLMLTIVLGATATSAGRLSQILGRRRLLPPPARRDAGPVTKEWLTQKLDHFDPTRMTTWPQKYFANTQYYKDGGPAFVFIGGEGAATEGWLQGGQMMDLAEKYGGAAFQLEHRYYGESYPTQNTSTPNLWYLRTEQALADLAYFIQTMKGEYNLHDSKWIAFGGSYAGNLAAWLRLKYPHLVHGAVSSSGPLLAKTDFYEYFEVVTNSLNLSSQQCVKDIRNATAEMTLLLDTAAGVEFMTELFNLCEPLDISKPNDVYSLFETLAGIFAGTVQYNYASRDSIGDLCEMVTDPERGNTPLQRYAALIKSTYECNQISFDNMLHEYEDVTWEGGARDGMRCWLYQTCTEYGYYQTSNSDKQPFGSGFPLSYFIDMCSKLFGKDFDQLQVDEGVERTNMFYGGIHPQLSNVVFVHGTVDPWHALGVLEDLSSDAQAIVINGTSHCEDMYSSSSIDPPQLTAAKTKIDTLVGEWLKK